MNNPHDDNDMNPSAPPCSNKLVNERNRYYVGKFFCPDDFILEQGFFLGRNHLHNRLFHGWGIVCGLDIEAEKDECDGWRLKVSEGIALDSCGREIILHGDATTVHSYEHLLAHSNDSDPRREEYANVSGMTSPFPADFMPGKVDEPLLLCVQYWEEKGRLTKALCSESGQAKDEYDRVCEYGRLVWVKPGDLPDTCWPIECHGAPQSEGCIEPSHICGADTNGSGETAVFVPLALVNPVEPHTNQPKQGAVSPTQSIPLQPQLPALTPPPPSRAQDEPFELSYYQRKYVSRAETFTRITKVAPEHEGELLIKVDGDSYGKANNDKPVTATIEVTFEHKVHADTINANTFLVHYVDLDDDELQYLSPDTGYPKLKDNDPCSAVFQTSISRKKVRRFDGCTFFVTLKCDFVLDDRSEDEDGKRKGRAVDGNHLRGQLPSGDGVEGGTFESWFTLNVEE